MTSAATSSMSSALSLPNGRGMSSNERAVSPFTVTSKQPLRGFSSLTTTLAPGKPALTSASSLVALVLNAPQDLQASILTKASPLAAFLGGAAFFPAAGFFAIVFVGGIIPISVQSSRQFQAVGLTRARDRRRAVSRLFIPQPACLSRVECRAGPVLKSFHSQASSQTRGQHHTSARRALPAPRCIPSTSLSLPSSWRSPPQGSACVPVTV